MKRSGILALALLTTLALGCSNGPRRAPVSGIVRVDGKPLERGVINFVPSNGTTGPGAGGEIANGEFYLDELQGPVVGTNRVEIRGFRKTGRKIAPMGSPMDEEIQVVPEQYNARSTLTCEIKHGGNNEVNFELVRKK